MTRIPTQTIELARQLWSEGYYGTEIARRTGMSAPSVSRFCRDLPKPIKNRGGRKPSVRLYATSEDFEQF